MERKNRKTNFLDYLTILLKRKGLIFSLPFTAVLVAILVTLTIPDVYRSEATIIPRPRDEDSAEGISPPQDFVGIAGEIVRFGARGDVDKFEIVLKSRELTRRVVEKYDLMPDLFEDQWDPLMNGWRESPSPTFQDAYNLLMGMLKVSRQRSTDILTLAFEHEDPRFAKIMIGNYLAELSESLREETLEEAAENKRFLREQLDTTSDILLKEKLWILLSKEIEKEIFLRAQRYHGFIILDPPVAADPDKMIKPNRSLIVMLSGMAALFVAIILAFLLEFLESIKTREGEQRLNEIRRYLKLRPIRV
jgi:uncharacterized protein involved in exopolysaccharide biosynthesis